MIAFAEFSRQEFEKMETIISGNPGLLAELKHLGSLHSEIVTLNQETRQQISEISDLKTSLSQMHWTLKENAIPKQFKILAYAFMAIGAVIGTGFIINILLKLFR